MKKSVLFSALMIFCGLSNFAQEKVTANVSKNGNDVSIETNKDYVLQYESPTNGIVTFKDKTFAKAKLNINLLTNEILFLNEKNQLIPLDNQNSVQFISIDKDIYFNSTKGLVQQLANINEVRLGILRTFKTENKAATGAYGIPSTTSSVTQSSTFSSSQSSTLTNLSVNQKVDLGYHEIFYLIKNDKYYSITNEKQFSKVFKKDKEELEKYVKQENLDINKREDLLKLFNYCSSFDNGVKQ